jgi:hypothetical protein
VSSGLATVCARAPRAALLPRVSPSTAFAGWGVGRSEPSRCMTTSTRPARSRRLAGASFAGCVHAEPTLDWQFTGPLSPNVQIRILGFGQVCLPLRAPNGIVFLAIVRAHSANPPRPPFPVAYVSGVDWAAHAFYDGRTSVLCVYAVLGLGLCIRQFTGPLSPNGTLPLPPPCRARARRDRTDRGPAPALSARDTPPLCALTPPRARADMCGMRAALILSR